MNDGSILIFSGVRGDTRRYRTLHLYEQLRLVGVDCVATHLTNPRLPDLIRAASVVVLHRVAFDSYVEKLFNLLRANGALAVLDADDFLYDPSIMRWIDSPDFQDPVRASLYRRELLRHRAVLDHCDALTVSTQSLADMLTPFGKPVHVHRNAFNLDMLALSDNAWSSRKAPNDHIVIGYASGTRTHDRDFNMIRPVLRALMQRYPQIELWLMGALNVAQDWGELQPRVRAFPLVPWRELPARLAMLDINLAPLVPDSPFNQAKSEIKYVEAALVRVPTIATPTEAYRYALNGRRSGLLAEKLEAWSDALDFLVKNPEARRAMGEDAYADVKKRYTPWQRGQEFCAVLAQIAAETGNKIPASVIYAAQQESAPRPPYEPYFTQQDEAHPTYAGLARYALRHRGLGTLLGQGWVYFRRKLAPIFPFTIKESQ